MDQLAEFFNNNWLIISFLAPMSWALVNIIDVYFVGGIYKDEVDGTIISGLFQILPWPIIFFITGFELADAVKVQSGLGGTLLLSFVGGALYTTSFYFYFKALFSKNDVSQLQIFWSLTIIAVPLLSFIIFNETLPYIKYFGMAVVLAGSVMLSLNPKLRASFSKRYFKIMLGAVLFLSFSMIAQGKAYNSLSEIYGNQGFWLGFFFFSLGAFTTGLLFSLFFKRSPLPLVKKYYKIFLLGEGVFFLGNLFSQKAINIAPSVSYVAAIETFTPVFILIYSLIILFFCFYIIKRKNALAEKIYAEQIGGIWTKILATIIMAIGVYIIS